MPWTVGTIDIDEFSQKAKSNQKRLKLMKMLANSEKKNKILCFTNQATSEICSLFTRELNNKTTI